MDEPRKHYAKYKKLVTKDHLFELSGIAKFLETECRSVAARSGGSGEKWGLMATEYGSYFEGQVLSF